MAIPIALQLYTVREDTAKDFIGTLAKVAEMGYSGVEFAGYGGLSAKDLKGHLERLGLLPVGSHAKVEELEKGLDPVIAYAVELGNPYLVCSKAPLTDRAAVKKFAALFNGIGERIQGAGLEFCYHNHADEFVMMDGEYALDLLYKETDSGLVEFELDVGWIYAAGADPVKYIGKYAGRCPLIHLKDMKPGEEKKATEVGAGAVDIKGIVREADKVGVDWLIVEQDDCDGPALESARISLENLRKMGLA